MQLWPHLIFSAEGSIYKCMGNTKSKKEAKSATAAPFNTQAPFQGCENRTKKLATVSVGSMQVGDFQIYLNIMVQARRPSS
jgi:hypothetical protein